MTGPQHYAEAERLLAEADTSDREYAHNAIARAQVHATLAQVAAIIDQTHDLGEAGMTQNTDEWTNTVASTNP